jgi:GNAT superfamily N-acetyltransferase
MSVCIRPAYRSDADAVAAFLNRHMNPRIPPRRWRNLFHFPWALPAGGVDYGRVALADGEVVGFISRIFSERMIKGRRELIANISSWYLRKDYRRGSLGMRLYRQLLDERGPATYTVVSIARRTYPVYDRWGFGMLDRYRWLWRRSSSPTDDTEVIIDRRRIERALNEEQRKMLADHRGFDLWPALIRTPDGDCLAVLTAKYKGDDVLFLDILHLSRPDLFERCARQVANRLLPAGKSVLAVDARFVSAAPLAAERVPIAVPRRYLSDRVAPRALDFMYSEIVLLNLKLS